MVEATYSSAQQARQVLADRLRDLRVDAGLTGREHALRCEWSIAKTSRIENNKTAPSAADIRIWCHTCGADNHADDLVTSLRTVEGMFIEWRRLSRDGLRHAQHSLTTVYERAQRFRSYSSWLIPGMLQTPAYTKQVLRIVQERILRQRNQVIDDVDQAIAARLDRQRLLTDRRRVFAFLVEESVLRSGIGGTLVMRDQLHHLTEIGGPNLSLGIIPMRHDRPRWPAEDFWIYDDAQVSVELVSGSLTVTQAHEITVYAETFAELASLAVYGAEARKLIAAAIDSL